MARGLRFPEGPIAMADGSVLLVEVARGTLSRVRADGAVEVVAELGGGPNGAALGPDGAVYVCNNGGFRWHEGRRGLVPLDQADDYRGGRIERVDLATGEARVLYDRGPNGPLKGPNDIVFDRAGGMWFTDHGKTRERDMDRGGVYYASIDGRSIREAIYPLLTPNGIGLSPDESRLYVAETLSGRLWAFDLEAPGVVKRRRYPSLNGGELVAGLPGFQLLDSLALESDGRICVATLFNGGITLVAPDGSGVEHLPMPDDYTTNICFGGPGLGTAYVTLSMSGRLAALDWPRPGLALNFAR